ncbi:uncharacterized protein LOC108678941 isoform X1 [Hyalella azteca]|uniref:Uncharacterized protein LOC108678941 isoform X1 n=1 Tax=Hyalella azteca TaxID=294128 RepID=A0A979FX87_HYAAZ|nr:uncharacterized protein LOC108678941 isoform X1 [Hyalella azteca]
MSLNDNSMEDSQKFTSAALELVLEKESDQPSLATKVGVLMSTNLEVATAILSALSAVQVSRLLSICRLWHSVGLKELQRRKNMQFIFMSSNSPLQQASDTSQEERLCSWAQQWRSVPRFCLVLNYMSNNRAERMLEDSKLLPPTCPIVEVQCEGGIFYSDEVLPHNRTVDHNLSFCGSLKCPNMSLPSEPIFLPKTAIKAQRSESINQSLDQTPAALDISVPQSSNSEINSDTSFVQSLQQEMLRAQQEKASLNCVLCRNVLRWNVGPSYVDFMHEMKGFEIICVPNIPGVTFRSLEIGEKQKSANSSNSTEDLVTWNGCLPVDERVRAVLVFDDRHTNLKPYLEQLIKKEQGNVAVVGGMPFDHIEHPSGSSIRGMAVCGENVTAASVIIPSPTDGQDMTRPAMSKFLKFYDPCKTSVAFFVTSIRRPPLRENEEDENKP